VWLKQWSEVNQRYGGNPQVGKYIGIYFAFGIGSAALVVVQTLILWIFCSIEVCLCSAQYARGTEIANGVLGKPEATRADGLRDLPLANELLRNHPCRTHPQSILKVCSIS
jgi:hypothetical protein